MFCLRLSNMRAGRDGSLDQAVSCGPSNPSDGYVTHQYTALALKLHVTCLPPANMPALYRAAPPSHGSTARRTRCPQLATHSAHSHVFQLLVGLGQSKRRTSDDVLHYGRLKPRPLCYPTWRASLVLSVPPAPFCSNARPWPPERGLGI